MAPPWESRLQRWVDAGLIDGDAAARIRAWEGDRPSTPSMRWPAWLALALGGLLLGAGILLFVAAHWDGLSPAERFMLVLSLVGGLHLAGALAADRSPGLSAALHACGSVALGAGIFLAGQIFHLEEHWPGGLFLWALGAGIGWLLLGQWPQAALAAVLTPAWLAGEWIVASEELRGGGVLGTGLVLLSLAYVGAVPASARESAVRRALLWIGGLGLIPAGLTMAILSHWNTRPDEGLPTGLAIVGWTVAVGVPLVAGMALRRANLLPLSAAAVWTIAGTGLLAYRGVAPYLWCAVLSIGLIAWGVQERRPERINLGMAGFALTVLVFYFSDVMDRLGRSASLIGLGLLFLGGGYLLEQTRRRLLAGVREADW